MAENRYADTAWLWLCLFLPGLASAQSYVDRNLSIAPAPPEARRPIVILAPVQPGSPPPVPARVPHNGPVGSYASDAPGPDIRARNTDYLTQFQVVGSLPAGSAVSKVAWRYGLSSKPSGFEALLCWQDAGHCWNVSDAGSGSTDFFNGQDATKPFVLYYRVKGSGYLPGGWIKGDINQVIVTYDVPR